MPFTTATLFTATRRALPRRHFLDSTSPDSFTPTLQHFLLRTEILKAYRSAVRATRPLPSSEARRETLDFLRDDLEYLKRKKITDVKEIRENLAGFKRMMKQFLPSIGLSSFPVYEGSQNEGGTGAGSREGAEVARLVGQRKKASR